MVENAGPVRETSRFDVAVVGASLSGLVCSTYLAKQGLRVAPIEGSNRVGGCTVNFERQGFVLDPAFYFVSWGVISVMLNGLNVDRKIQKEIVSKVKRNMKDCE